MTWDVSTGPVFRFGLILLISVLACRVGEKATPAPPPACAGPAVLRVAVQAGDYIHAVADQGARDVDLTLSDSRGRKLLHVDSLTAEVAPHLPAEEIHWVADAPGELRIAVALLEGPGGPCGLRLAERRRATEADRRRALAEAELARAHELRRAKDPQGWRAAVAVYKSAEGHFAELGLPRRQAEALLGLGQLQLLSLGNKAEAIRTFTRAGPLFAGNPAFEAKVRLGLGELRYYLGDLDGAIEEYRRALVLYHELGDRSDEALTANDMGDALRLLGRYDEAAALFDDSLARWRPGDGLTTKALTLLNRGLLHRDLGEMDLARERFDEALALFRQIGDRDRQAATLNALGNLAKDADQPAAALQSLQKALALRAPESGGWAVTQATLGAVYRRLGRPEDARQAYEKALPIFRRLGETRAEAGCLGNLGWLEVSTGQGTAALDHFDQASKLFQTLADPPNLAWTLEGQALALRRRGDLEAARGRMDEALAAIEQHRFSQASYNTRAGFFATQQDRYDFLIDLLMEMHREGEALEVSERSLARSLLDGLAAAGTDLRPSGADPREREIEREIDALVSLQTRLSQDPATTPEQLRLVERDLGRRWDELDRVRAALRTADPRYAALTQPRPWKAADIQRRLLDRDTLLLEYRLGERRSLLWAVTPDSLQVFVLPGRGEIERAAQAGSWTRRGSEAEVSARLQLATLGRLLLDPVARLLPGKRRLLVVGDGVLQSVPFAALPEPGTPDPLIARHEIVFLPSVSVLGELRREAAGRQQAPRALWVLANPEFGKTFDRLPYSGREAEEILKLVPASERVEVQGPEATRSAVLGSPLRDFRFLHFATHGFFDADDPRLVLAQVDPRGRPEPNGFLHLADIYKLKLRADLVVLSACQSALGKEVPGEGMMGMTRGFFYTGADRVLVSLWNVNDRVTVPLMGRFYRGILVDHLSPAAALRRAQDEIRRQKEWQAPYNWAGFTLQGEWR